MRLAWLGKRREHPCPPIQPMGWRRRQSSSRFLETFREFPPSQKAAGFTIDPVLAKMSEAASARH